MAEFARISDVDIEAAIKYECLKAAHAVHQLIKNKKKVSQEVRDGYSRLVEQKNDGENLIMSVIVKTTPYTM